MPHATHLPLALPAPGPEAGLQAGQVRVAVLKSEAPQRVFGFNISYDFVLRVTF